jgi:AcrR family transcriptional regulator
MEGQPVTSVAKEVGVHRSTVHNWFGSQDFLRAVASYRRSAIEAAHMVLSQSAHKAILTLTDIVDSGEERNRVKAASVILDTLVKFEDALDIRNRMDRLEDALCKRQHGQIDSRKACVVQTIEEDTDVTNDR